jgi:decaprenyl-phosphate phosphoribosyltransferase
MKLVLELLKIKHWIKNLFIFMPLFFALKLFDLNLLLITALVFISFCFVSVFIYIFNDIIDSKKDSTHPKKSQRPIASGKIKPLAALIIGIIFGIIGILISLTVGFTVTLILLIYIAMNIFYSLWLKNIVILDVFIIAIGFCLRVIIGAVAINVDVTNWIILATFSISLIIGFGKRLQELELLGNNAVSHRDILVKYNKRFLEIMIVISTSITGISYALYTMDPEVINKFNVETLIFSVPIVLFGLFRYLYLVFCKNQGGSPEELVMSDPGIIISVILWLLFMFITIYYKDQISVFFTNIHYIFNIKLLLN